MHIIISTILSQFTILECSLSEYLSTVEGQCEEFTFKPVQGAWGTIHPVSKPGKALDYWTRQGKIGLWGTHSGSNQLWKLAGDHLVTKRRYKVATPGSDGIVQMVKASCDDSNQHWQIHDSCTSGNAFLDSIIQHLVFLIANQTKLLSL